MKQVLLFPDHHEPQYDSHEQVYLAVYSEAPYPAEKLRELSPHLMQWSEQIWIIDLSYTMNYWQTVAGQTQSNCHDLWETLIKNHLGHDNFTVAVTHHPWQSLLLLAALEEIGTTGLMLWQSNYAQNILRHLSWESWWRLAREFFQQSGANGYLKKSQVTKAQQNLTTMKKVVARMACHYPHQLHQMPPAQMRRRFGIAIEELWSWSYPELGRNVKNSLEYETNFPWCNAEFAAPPSIKRNLDYPVEIWEQISDLIAEDINKLCFSPSFNKELYTMCLEWRVVLHDLREIPIKVFFRHPHSLPAEIPSQRTALLQIKYSFHREMKATQQTYDDIEQPLPQIIAWKLTVKESLAKPSYLLSLFEDDMEGVFKLTNLENQIHTPLHTYQSVDHWVPEHSFRLGHKGQAIQEAGQEQSIQALASQRPLFTFAKPQPFAQAKTSAMWKFVERTMDQWWSPHDTNTRRDYYQYINNNKKYWVYRDVQGKWYVHGIFA